MEVPFTYWPRCVNLLNCLNSFRSLEEMLHWALVFFVFVTSFLKVEKKTQHVWHRTGKEEEAEEETHANLMPLSRLLQDGLRCVGTFVSVFDNILWPLTSSTLWSEAKDCLVWLPANDDTHMLGHELKKKESWIEWEIVVWGWNWGCAGKKIRRRNTRR